MISLKPRGRSLKKKPRTSSKKNRKKSKKFQGFFLGFKIRTPYLGVNNPSISVFKLFFIHIILVHQKKIRRKSEKIWKIWKNPKIPSIFWGFKIRTTHLGVNNPSIETVASDPADKLGPGLWLQVKRLNCVKSIWPSVCQSLKTKIIKSCFCLHGPPAGCSGCRPTWNSNKHDSSYEANIQIFFRELRSTGGRSNYQLRTLFLSSANNKRVGCPSFIHHDHNEFINKSGRTELAGNSDEWRQCHSVGHNEE